MTASTQGAARRIYRVLLRAYPRAMRERYGEEMEETFLALLGWEGERRGLIGKVTAWVRGGWDAVAGGVLRRFGLGPENSGGQGPYRKSTQGSGVWEMMGTVWGDIRFAVRALIRRPLFSATVILTLAVGIGANASVFTLVDGLLFTPLPYDEPEELVLLSAENPVKGWSNVSVSPLNAQDWIERSHALEDLATFYNQDFSLTGDGPPELLSGIRVAPNVLGLLERSPVLGRGFSEEEVGEGRDGVVILTDGFWQRRFGGDRGVLGSTIVLEGVPRVVVGIMPPGFRFLDARPDVFLPLDLTPADRAREDRFLKALGRLAPGVSLGEARIELRQIAVQLQEEYPEANADWTVQLVSLHEDMLGPWGKSASLILMVAVGFILLMVCVNLANLLLARGEHRARELAIRTALGAGRGQVVRQLITESLVLGSIGGGLGFLLANWGYRGVVAALPTYTSPNFQFGLDGSVLVFTMAITLAAVLLFGVFPALRASRSGLGELRGGGRSGRSVSSAHHGSALVVLQTAIALALLVGGGLLIKSVSGMKNQDLGFEPRNVLVVRLTPPATEYPERADTRAFWNAVENRVAEIPGVAGVGTTQSHPLMGATWLRTVRMAGEDEDRTARLTYLSGGLFNALGFRVVSGRPIQSTDDEDAPEVAVVNEAFIRMYLGQDVDPLSTLIQAGSDTLPPVPIVGVIHDVVEGSLNQAPGPALYLSISPVAVRTRSLVIRTAGPPGEMVGAVQDAVWSIDPKLPLFQMGTMAELVENNIGGFVVVANLMTFFACLSLFLGGLGIYGVTAYSTGRRTSEIGIRLAMGAEPRDVVRMVVGQGGRRALLGLVLGLVLAFLVTGAMGSFLVGVDLRDPAVYLSVTLILAGVSFLALWIPARRASAVGPMAALTSE
jgi:predicted permease